MERIGDLELFLRVYDLGSISAAARSLELSPAVGSQRLKRLEHELGVRLMHRTTRRLHPTPEGTTLARQSRPLIEDLAALTSDLRQTGTDVSGMLRVTMPSSFGRGYISPLLPEFLTRHPQLQVSMHLSDQMIDLVGTGFDLAIRIGTLEDSSLVARRLASNCRVLCAAPSYLQRHGAPRTPQDLGNHECLLQTGNQGVQSTWHLQDANGNDHAIRVGGRIRSNQGELLSDAATAGLGIAQHSIWHIHDDLQAGRLQVVLPEYHIAETGIYAVMPQRRLVPPRVRAFVDFLVEHLADMPSWESL